MTNRYPAASVATLPLALTLFLLLLSPAPAGPPTVTARDTVTVLVGPKPVNTFRTDEALGAGVDGMQRGDVAQVYRPENFKAMRSAGFRPLTYRIRTELSVAAWHWNPAGKWSDAAHHQGYWTSDDHAASSIQVCYGYDLPRRGNTIDQGNDRGYSRLDDGRAGTFWKSNPYLDAHFTGESNTRHPQWVVVDFGKKVRIDTARIRWAEPYATAYQVEYWEGKDGPVINGAAEGEWRRFPSGNITLGNGGDVTLRLSPAPIPARYARLLLTAASGTAPSGSKDIRDRLGYAIRELYLGVTDAHERFHDRMRHGTNADTQTLIATSSTDPWHREQDRDRDIEQPGLDRVFASGLTSGLPLLTPVGVLYDTPENAAALVRFLRGRKYPVRRIEMGEEPDGQYIVPEDYAALYCRFANAIHHEDKTLALGGPGFQTDITGWRVWADEQGNRAWMSRFIGYLRAHDHLADFSFFTFEWYPFDDVCASSAQQLAVEPFWLARVHDSLIRDGVPKDIPWIIAEYGYSAFAGQVEMELPAALLNAEITTQFLTLGGSTAYLYGYEPNIPITEGNPCHSYGNLTLFLADDERRVRYPLPTYYGAKLLTQDWAMPGHRAHELYRAFSNVRNAAGQPLVTAYAVKRPDRTWALLLLNKDPANAHSVGITFQDSGNGRPSGFTGPVTMLQYSSKQYRWHANREHGHPILDLPPETHVQPLPPGTPVVLPPYSLTVVRGTVSQ